MDINSKLRNYVYFIFSIFLLQSSSNTYIIKLIQREPFIENSYIDELPMRLSKQIKPNTNILLTEAGRFAYWIDANFIDLVGLNTPYTAVNVPDLEYIFSQKPDIFFVHQATTIDIDKLIKLLESNNDEKIIEISQIDITKFINSQYDNILFEDHKLPNTENIFIAPIMTFKYLSVHKNEFRTFLIKYYNEYSHIFAVNVDYENIDEVVNQLYRVVNQNNYSSYLDLKNED